MRPESPLKAPGVITEMELFASELCLWLSCGCQYCRQTTYSIVRDAKDAKAFGSRAVMELLYAYLMTKQGELKPQTEQRFTNAQ